EYKRQHLNALRMLALLGRLEANPGADILPRTFLFGAKAAPGYHLAKRIIKLIWMIGTEMRRSPAARDRFHLVYLENYGVTASELLMPASEISEQISLAGTEASGTGNMKLSLSGAVTVGTLDGANLEIFREAGEGNNLPFGMTSEEVSALRGRGYDPRAFLEADPELRYAVERLRAGVGGEDFSDLAELLETADFYMACADFRAYMDAEDEADRLYRDRDAWNRMSLANIAASPEFFVDRTVREYCEKIWNA
ncbi:MAG TPA: glycogen/starch/alpha-glucan phosphorylase, partial [Oscillospiraceae bacterium]|nr:glycogen/starch/alpha-glucan phosphorylase [Oscillospiraceae bacterium]